MITLRELLVYTCIILVGVCAYLFSLMQYRDKNARIGRYVWLSFVAILCENLLVIKMGWDVVTIPVPRVAVAFWSSLAAVFVVWVFWHFTLPFKYMPGIGPYYRRFMAKLKLSYNS